MSLLPLARSPNMRLSDVDASRQDRQAPHSKTATTSSTARVDAPTTQTTSQNQFADLPRQRSTGTQSAPTMHDASTQVTNESFMDPSAPVPASATVAHSAQTQRRLPASDIDRPATDSATTFRREIREARTQYGDYVRFTKVKDGDREIGYILSARHALPSAVETGKLPVLYVAGTSSASRSKTTFTTDGNILAVAGNRDTPTALATELRRSRTQSGHGTLYEGPDTLVPNYRVKSSTLKAMDAAVFVRNAGRSLEHKQPVDVFVAAPGQSVHLSTVMRTLEPGKYNGVLYAMN